MICKLLCGESVSKVASDLKVRSNTIIDWRNRFSAQGVAGFYDRPRSGKPPRYDEEFRAGVLKTLKQPPPPGQSCWDGPAVALAHRMMRFGAYFAPEKALVISVDEKPSIQERTTDYVCASSGKVVSGLKSTYKRHATLDLFCGTQRGHRVPFIRKPPSLKGGWSLSCGVNEKSKALH